MAPVRASTSRRTRSMISPATSAGHGSSNGRFAPELSSPETLASGVEVGSLADSLTDGRLPLEVLFERSELRQQDGFGALNASLAGDGAFVRLGSGAVVAEPVHLVFVSQAGEAAVISNPRSVVLAGPNSRATIVESYVGLSGEVYLTNSVTQVMLEDGAAIEHFKVQDEQDSAFHLAVLDVRQDRNSRFISHSFAFGGRIATRGEPRTRRRGRGGHGERPLHAERGPSCTTTRRSSSTPRPRLHEPASSTRAWSTAAGYGVFNGRIVVRPGSRRHRRLPDEQEPPPLTRGRRWTPDPDSRSSPTT